MSAHRLAVPHVVIPAKAGIQFEYVVRSTQNLLCRVLRTSFSLDSGVRRNDERAGRDACAAHESNTTLAIRISP